MEQMFVGASFLSQLGATLFCCPLLGWFARAQKLYIRGLPFLLGVVAVIWRLSGGDDDRPRSCRPGERNKVKPGSRGEDDGPGVRLRDVETIVERMGIGGGCVDGDEPRGAVGADDLERLFEEKEPSLEEVKAAFCVFDHDGDGFIESGELRRVLRLLGFEEATAADCRRMIDAHDENGDGRIDFNEFVKLMESSFC